MNIAVIADDLTGANDSGVQFVRSGLRPVVAIQDDDRTDKLEGEVVIYNTDSRSVSSMEAYRRTKALALRLKEARVDMVYKKMDSTMRGNVGAEFDAVYDALNPRFLFFTPAYPGNGRTVKDGYLYVEGRRVHDTEFANDPKTPITESYIPSMIEAQSSRRVGIVTVDDVARGYAALLSLLNQYAQEERRYILFDAYTEQDLAHVAELGRRMPFSVVWAGSAGLAQWLVPAAPSPPAFRIRRDGTSALIVVGSVHPKSRRQKRYLLEHSRVEGIEMSLTALMGSDEDRANEMTRIQQIAESALSAKRDILLYAAGDSADIEWMRTRGRRYGLNAQQISDRISDGFGHAAALLVRGYGLNKVVLTGGDIAVSFCSKSNIRRFVLLDELEPGIPIGVMSGERELYAVTKAGGFGSDHALARALSILKGEETICAR